VAAHIAVVATGGIAGVAAPFTDHAADLVAGDMGGSIIVGDVCASHLLAEGLCLNISFIQAVHTGFEGLTTSANDLIIGIAEGFIPLHSEELISVGTKDLLITLKFKHTMQDAALGFYHSSLHADKDLFANVKDDRANEQGWFSPYLFASSRRPTGYRTMKPDIVLCHGPFLSGKS
jgi:hypothetical protein